MQRNHALVSQSLKTSPIAHILIEYQPHTSPPQTAKPTKTFNKEAASQDPLKHTRDNVLIRQEYQYSGLVTTLDQKNQLKQLKIQLPPSQNLKQVGQTHNERTQSRLGSDHTLHQEKQYRNTDCDTVLQSQQIRNQKKMSNPDVKSENLKQPLILAKVQNCSAILNPLTQMKANQAQIQKHTETPSILQEHKKDGNQNMPATDRIKIQEQIKKNQEEFWSIIKKIEQKQNECKQTLQAQLEKNHNDVKLIEGKQNQSSSVMSHSSQHTKENQILESPSKRRFLQNSSHVDFMKKSLPPQTFIFREQFKIGQFLGNGRFSQVYAAREKTSGILFALKIINKEVIRSYNFGDQLITEIKLQSNLNHPNITKLYGYYQDDASIYLINEFCEQGELFKLQYKSPNHHFNEKVSAYYMKQIISALDYMHSKAIMHRDLKPENILLSMIADFGFAARFPRVGERRTTFCGTIDYISPEIVTGGGTEPCEDGEEKVRYRGYDQKCDIWSLGILAFEMNCGYTPFVKKGERDENAIMKRICEVRQMNWDYLQVGISYPSHFSHELEWFIEQCLQKSSSKRPQTCSLQYDPWITKYAKERVDPEIDLGIRV